MQTISTRTSPQTLKTTNLVRSADELSNKKGHPVGFEGQDSSKNEMDFLDQSSMFQAFVNQGTLLISRTE